MLLKIILLATAMSLTTASDVGRKCDPKSAPCPKDMTCVPDDPYCPSRKCTGHCEFANKYPSCGGFTPTPHVCDKSSECKDDPRLPGSCGMACDAPGICIPKKAPQCGGLIGGSCPKGLFCYDALDSCDPNNGGADCIGICL